MVDPVRLLIVGGGHATLPLLDRARDLAPHADVTLLSDRPELWYSGMVPEWTGGVYTRDDVTIDLAAICAREGIRFVQARASRLDRERRTVSTASGETLTYDLLVIDVGAHNPGDSGSATPTKPLHRIQSLADLREGRLVIVGGGAAGVETALNVTAGCPGVHVTLIEPGDRLLSGLPERAGRWAHDLLDRRGADIRLHTQAAQVDADGVRLVDGDTVGADAVLWATGSVGQSWLADSGLPTTEKGFVRVQTSLLAQTDARIFVAGDAAAVDGHESLARIGVHAVKQGPLLAENVRRSVESVRAGDEPDDAELQAFRPYPVAPLILSTGEPWAIAAAGPVAGRGRWALALKHLVDRRWMAKYRVDPPSYRSWIDLGCAGDRPA